MRRTYPLFDITPIGIEFVAAAFAGCALRRRDIAQVVPHRIARYLQLPGNLPNAHPLAGEYFDFHLFLYAQHDPKRAKIYTRWVSFKLLAVGQFKGSSSLCVKGKQPVQLE